MKRTLGIALALAATLAFAVPALADGHGEKLTFPVQGTTFVQHVEARIAKTTARVEEMIAKRNLPKAEADAARAKLADGVAKVRAEAQKAAADGTVTKEEADQVRAVSRELHAGGGHCDGDHGKHDGSNAKTRS